MYVCMAKPNKYAKTKIELMELKLTHQHQQQTHFGGVITRARALALQRAQAANEALSCLQLRSRRLQKLNASKKKRKGKNGNGLRLAGEGDCGENVVETEARSTRETTPCSLIRNPDAVTTPGSTTRCTASANTDRTQNSSVNMPTAQQMDEFFGDTENEDQRRFIEKYNFDVINDKPLPGRYKWEKLDP